jgi:hypothetical protein
LVRSDDGGGVDCDWGEVGVYQYEVRHEGRSAAIAMLHAFY